MNPERIFNSVYDRLLGAGETIGSLMPDVVKELEAVGLSTFENGKGLILQQVIAAYNETVDDANLFIISAQNGEHGVYEQNASNTLDRLEYLYIERVTITKDYQYDTDVEVDILIPGFPWWCPDTPEPVPYGHDILLALREDLPDDAIAFGLAFAEIYSP